MRSTLTCAAVFFVIVFGVLGADTNRKIKEVSMVPTSPASGQEMFANYCAACHGQDGKGGGPAAAALNRQPADLTQLTVKNSGSFPELAVIETLVAGKVVAHGSPEMPVWGELFKRLDSDRSNRTQLRIANLTAYIKSLQAK